LAIYFIDYENVGSTGIEDVDKLDAGNVVHIFYSLKADTMKIEQVIQLMNVKADVQFHDVTMRGQKNALDFQLIAMLYFTKQEKETCYIISKDTGYDAAVVFGRKIGAANVYRKISILDALNSENRTGSRREPAGGRSSAASQAARPAAAPVSAPEMTDEQADEIIADIMNSPESASVFQAQGQLDILEKSFGSMFDYESPDDYEGNSAAVIEAASRRSDAMQAETVKAAAVRTDAVRAEVPRTAAVRTEAARTAAARAEAARTDTVKAETARTETAKADAVKTEPVKAAPAAPARSQANGRSRKSVKKEDLRFYEGQVVRKAAAPADAAVKTDAAVTADTKPAANEDHEAEAASGMKADSDTKAASGMKADSDTKAVTDIKADNETKLNSEIRDAFETETDEKAENEIVTETAPADIAADTVQDQETSAAEQPAADPDEQRTARHRTRRGGQSRNRRRTQNHDDAQSHDHDEKPAPAPIAVQPDSPEFQAKVTGIMKAGGFDLADDDYRLIGEALRTTKNKNQFYQFFRKKRGEAVGREFYLQIRGQYENLKTLREN